MHPDAPYFSIGLFQKKSILLPRRKFLPSGGGGEKKLFLIIVNVLGHPKEVGGLTSYFLCGESKAIIRVGEGRRAELIFQALNKVTGGKPSTRTFWSSESPVLAKT
jgi:hypothetical protein